MTEIRCRHCHTKVGDDPARCAECGATEFVETPARGAPTSSSAAPRKATRKTARKTTAKRRRK